MDIAQKNNVYETLESKRIAARKYKADGWSYINIAKELNCSRSCASKWCKLNENELRPKKRGIKQKIPEDLKSELLLEFIASNLSVRKFILTKHRKLLEMVSLRTIDRYLFVVKPKNESNEYKHENIVLNKFCQKCNKSFPEFCQKVRLNSELDPAQLNKKFYLTRKSEDWTSWEHKKKKPLESTRLQVAFLSYYYGYSHGEMMPEALISSGLYTKILKLNWQQLIVADVSTDEQIENLVLFTRKNTGEPSRVNFPSYCKNNYFIKTSNILRDYFSLFKLNEKESTWMPSHYFDLSGDLLEYMLRISYFDFNNKKWLSASAKNSL